MKQLLRLTYLLLLVLALVACQNENTPTPEATTEIAAATNTSSAPSATNEPTATATTEPAASTATSEPTIQPSLTTEPTATFTPEPTETPEPLGLTISQPISGSELPVGADLTVSGVVAPTAAATVNLSLQAGPTILITGTATVDSNTGAWLTTMTRMPG